MTAFPSLAGFEPTRQTLHLYAQAVGVVPRTHAEPHPKWWHVSLKVTADGLRTESFTLPDGRSAWLEMDLRRHEVRLTTLGESLATISMTDGLTGTEFGNQLLAAVAAQGLEGEYARERFENDDPRVYERQMAENFFTALTSAHEVFVDHRASIPGEKSPVQLWPHGFDLAMEWYGTRVATYEEHGEVQEFPAQLNLGFYPGGDPYFYSNPWPFEEEQLLDEPLSAGARWHTEGWAGSLLPYSELVGDDNARDRLLEYARRVYDVAAPTLLA